MTKKWEFLRVAFYLLPYFPAGTHWFNVRSLYVHTYVPDCTNLVQNDSFEDVQFCMYYVRSTLNVIGMFHVCNGNQILLIVEPYQT